MNKQDILNYLRNTPENTNVNIVGNMLDELVEESGGGGVEESDYIQNKITLESGDFEWADKGGVYELTDIGRGKIINWLSTIDSTSTENMIRVSSRYYNDFTLNNLFNLSGRVHYTNGEKLHFERNHIDCPENDFCFGMSFEINRNERYSTVFYIYINTQTEDGHPELINGEIHKNDDHPEWEVEKIELYIPYTSFYQAYYFSK